MNNILLVSVIVLIVILVGLMIWIVFFSKPKKAEKEEVPQSYSVVRVRSAVSGKTVMEIYSDDLLVDGPVPFYSDLEQEEMKEETLIERWRRKDLSREEREELAREMRAVGYQVTLEGESEAAAGEAAPSVPAGGSGTPALPDSMDELFAIVKNPMYSEAYKSEAKRKLAVLLGTEPASEDEGEGGEDDDTHGEGNGQGTDDDFAGGGFEVDPVTGAPVSRETQSAPEEAGNSYAEALGAPVSREGVSVPEETADVREGDDTYLVTLDFPHDEKQEVDDDKDSRLAIELMRFIARSFRSGLIDPELVAFAERRLHLDVNYVWTEEEKVRVAMRSDKYNGLEEKSVEELDSFVRSVVEQKKKAHTVTKKEKKITLGFDPKGGKNDLVWKRLEDWGNEEFARS